MESYWKGILATVSVLALGLVIYQTVRVGKLERRITSLSRSTGSADTSDSDDSDVAALKRRIAALERTATRLLSLVLSRRNGAGGGADSGPGGAVTGKLRKLRADVDAVLSGDALSTEEGRNRLHKLVEKAQRQTRRKIWDRWRELFEHRMRKALKQFADSTGLTDGQLQKLTQLAYETIDKTTAIKEAYQRGEITPAQFLEKNKKARREMDQKVRTLLGDEVYQKFVKARRKFLGRR
jgi:predicted kinase